MSAPRNAGAELLSLATMNVHALQRNSGISLDQGKTSKKCHRAGPAADRRRAATAGGASRGDSQLVLPGEATTARSPTTSRLLKACIRHCCTLAVDSVEETFPQHNKMKEEMNSSFDETISHAADFTERVSRTQHQLGSELDPHYDFIVCGAGSSGSVVARRLAENADVSVLLLEAGGRDDVPSVMRAEQWPLNLGSERDWNFQSQPSPHVNGRSIPLSMGKVLGGGSSINVMVWARGHKNDWDFFASEA